MSGEPVEPVAADPVRLAAYDVVHAVTARDAFANLILPGTLTERGLGGRDAAFATELTYGTLRRLGTLDLVLGACSSRPWDRVDSDVRDVLRLGAYQILHMRVPAHAAVATSVDLAVQVARRGPAVRGFANAVLRGVARRSYPDWVAQVGPDPETDPLGHLAVEHAHPRWIAEAFAQALGEDDSTGYPQTAEAMEADNVPAPVTLVARPGRIERDELVAASGGEPGLLSPYAVVMGGGDPAALAAVRDRRAGVQDEGSQLVTCALAAAPLDAGPDERWLDMCAGPGGKAALLGALAASRDAHVVALEKASHRARLVRRATAGLPVEVVTGDATELSAGPHYDRVLLDAPCTGLGSLRRRPESRWRRTPQDLADLCELQGRLLDSAVGSVRPGGVVAYVTCSPHPAETTDRVSTALAEHPDLRQLDARALLPGGCEVGGGPHAQLWPQTNGTDAMFLALFRKPTHP